MQRSRTLHRHLSGSSSPAAGFTLIELLVVIAIIAVLIALPIAWWALNKLLENYPYRIAISWWIFGLALVLVVAIALLTISFQSIRAAVANPVSSLRSE